MAATQTALMQPTAELPAADRSSSHHSLTIEELTFCSAMSCFEGWLKTDPAIGNRTMTFVTKFITKTLDKTHNLKDVRENLAASVETWLWLTKDFAAAIPSLTTRSIGPLAGLNDPERAATHQESTALIIKYYQSLKEDLQLLIKLMHIARNLLVVSEPEVPQDLCAAAQFDQILYQTIILCINVTSKAFEGDILDEGSRHKLSEISELYKRLLVTCLQQAHNWIAKNDRNKMSFWSTVLFDDEAQDDHACSGGFRSEIAKVEIQNWIERNSRFCDKARRLLVEYEERLGSRGLPPGPLARIAPLAWNWLPEGSVKVRADDLSDGDAKITPQWKEHEPDKFEQDRMYGRVSREIDMWWLRVRDPNHDEWVVPMPTIEFAQQRTENCKANLVHRYTTTYRTDEHEDEIAEGEARGEDGANDSRSCHEYHDGMIEEEDVDDDDSYGEGPMNGLLTEVPNILDPKQIEALHLIVKSCILDMPGNGLSRAGENLQKTRCRMFLALECGRSLLREILVFLAVWEKTEQSMIFQLTTQIVEAVHHSALIPFAWQSLRIPKDIISPAQTVLLRLINNMFRARNNDPPRPESKEHLRDVKLLHFLFIQFRSRIVPECVALMHLQAQVHSGVCDPADFPVDSWDMERAKDGLHQFLELFLTVNELPETRAYLIEWEAAYELLVLLKGLEVGVPKKPLVALPVRSAQRQIPSPSSTRASAGSSATDDLDRDAYGRDPANPPPPPPPPPPLQEPAHKYPWAGIKAHILHILAGLLQPPPGRSSPGNPQVQKQIIRHSGIVSLLNCCVYDDHNRYARDRVQVCLKWLLDGCEAANNFLRDLVATSPPPPQHMHQPGCPTAAAGAANASAGRHGAHSHPPQLPPPADRKAITDGASANSSQSAQQQQPKGTTATLRITAAGELKSDVKTTGSGGATTVTTTSNKLPSLASASALGDGLRNAVSNTLPPINQAMLQRHSIAHRGGAEAFAAVAATGAAIVAALPSDAAIAAQMPASVQHQAQSARNRSEELLRDIINLADEAARLALGPVMADETADLTLGPVMTPALAPPGRQGGTVAADADDETEEEEEEEEDNVSLPSGC
ncbi:hypothetical protein QBC46DRAFT_382273 [Diplogelasinospora grovesii]|uniref:Ataxin-10 homolog n=1 Tax=Diplogelasinospora grovesii TaxID=303347 RepID=A0AAN6N9H6_9PEZI|nr:hypothetical protein QBC46DRAFT_382273 [Diplogelasinospora grovesii]